MPATKEGEVRRKINEDEFVEDADDEGLVKLKEEKNPCILSLLVDTFTYAFFMILG